MNRRELLQAGAATAALASVPLAAARRSSNAAKFSLKFAPHLGMFRHSAGEDPLEQIRFMADQGFTAFEDNGMRGRPPELQEAIGDLLEELGMQMGVFVAHDIPWGGSGFAKGDEKAHDKFVEDMKASVEVAKRCRAKWTTVVPGKYEPRLEWEYQTANVVEMLRRGAEVFEPHGLVMVLEPLNWYANHPELFLSRMPQAYLICRAVDSPACKILDDLYHQQISEGNLIPNMDRSWDEIGYFQIGDNPGRNEPGTGEIHYGNVFAHIKAKGFDGVLGMEHGNSQGGREGEEAVIAAYRAVDPG